MDLAKLVAKLELQSSQFQSELEKTNRKLLGFQRDSNKALTSMERQFRSFARSISGAFAGISLAAITGFVKQGIELGDAIGKAATKAGIGATAMSELAFAAKMADIDIDGLSNSIRFMQVALSKANSGGKEQVATLGALGLTLDNIIRLAPDQQFEALADAIASLRSPADRARAATELFGKSGADLLPLFEQGAAGIRKAREEAKKFGASFSEESVRALQEGDDAIKKLGVSWDSFWAKVAVGTVKLAEAMDLVDKDRIGELRDELESVNDELLRMQHGANLGALDPARWDELTKKAQALERQIANLNATYSRGGGPRRGPGAPAAPGFHDQGKPGDPLKEFMALNLGWTEEMRHSAAEAERFRALIDDVDRGVSQSLVETNENIADSFRDMREPIIAVNDQLSVFSEEAARNSQDLAAQFIYNLGEMEGGLRGFFKSFVDILRQMSAQVVASQIFDKLGGTQGIGNFFSSLFAGTASSGVSGGGNVPSYDVGTSYVPRDQLAMVHKGEAIIPANMNRIGGGMGNSVIVNTHIDARGSTADSVRTLIDVQRGRDEKLKAEIIRGIQTGKYPISK